MRRWIASRGRRSGLRERPVEGRACSGEPSSPRGLTRGEGDAVWRLFAGFAGVIGGVLPQGSPQAPGPKGRPIGHRSPARGIARECSRKHCCSIDVSSRDRRARGGPLTDRDKHRGETTRPRTAAMVPMWTTRALTAMGALAILLDCPRQCLHLRATPARQCCSGRAVSPHSLAQRSCHLTSSASEMSTCSSAKAPLSVRSTRLHVDSSG